MTCTQCGAELENRKCPYCGHIENETKSDIPVNITLNLNQNANQTINFSTQKKIDMRRASPKSKAAAIFLACLAFIGLGGLNRFYVGKKVSGIIYLLTFGLCWIGTIIDIVMLCNGTFTDSDGKPLLK